MVKSDYFSKIDMKVAYQQIPMHEDSIKYTAFVCEFGLYEYLSMPMGIASAPSWFQRIIDYTLKQFAEQNLANGCLDVIILFTATLEQHESIALGVIEALKKRNLKTSFEKLVAQEIDFPGSTIKNGTIKPLKKRVNRKSPNRTF
jgi:hypothetical protein